MAVLEKRTRGPRGNLETPGVQLKSLSLGVGKENRWPSYSFRTACVSRAGYDVIDWITLVQAYRNLKFIDVEELQYLTRSNPHLMNWYAVLEIAEHGGVDLRSRKLR